MRWRRCCGCRSATCAAAELAGGLPAARGELLLARIALAAGDHRGAGTPAVALAGELTPRHALVRRVLLAAAAIGRGDPPAAGIVGGALETARQGVPQHGRHDRTPGASYLIEHAAQAGRTRSSSS